METKEITREEKTLLIGWIVQNFSALNGRILNNIYWTMDIFILHRVQKKSIVMINFQPIMEVDCFTKKLTL